MKLGKFQGYIPDELGNVLLTNNLQDKYYTDPNGRIECGYHGNTPTTTNILKHQLGSTEVWLENKNVSFRLQPDQEHQVLLKDPYLLDTKRAIAATIGFTIGFTWFHHFHQMSSLTWMTM